MTRTYKWSHYQEIYDRHVVTPCRILEIGVGEGGSHVKWRAKGCTVFGIDKNPQCKLIESAGVTVFIGDVMDDGFMQAVVSQVQSLDYVLDDGGHRPYQVEAAFNHLWPITQKAYGIEDLQLSGRPHWLLWERLGLFGARRILRRFYDEMNAWTEPDVEVWRDNEVHLYPMMTWFVRRKFQAHTFIETIP